MDTMDKLRAIIGSSGLPKPDQDLLLEIVSRGSGDQREGYIALFTEEPSHMELAVRTTRMKMEAALAKDRAKFDEILKIEGDAIDALIRKGVIAEMERRLPASSIPAGFHDIVLSICSRIPVSKLTALVDLFLEKPAELTEMAKRVKSKREECDIKHPNLADEKIGEIFEQITTGVGAAPTKK